MNTPIQNRVTRDDRRNQLNRLSQMLSQLRHEFDNNASLILAALEMIKRKPELQERMLEVIREALLRIYRVLARSSANSQLRYLSPPHYTSLTAESILHEITNLLAPNLACQSIELRCETKNSPPFLADTEQLKHVLKILVQNAVDSISGSGSVTLRAKGGSAPLNGNLADAIIFEVEDTGSGITPENEARVFEMFFSTKPYGIGLGLTIAEQIVGSHGGEIYFQTEVNHGTVFTIVLPISQ